MPDCELLPRCPFFHDKMKDMPAVAEALKKRLCRGDKTGCARYMVVAALGKGTAPEDLFPNHVDRAQKIIKEKTG
jgi:hypothetical protein